MEAFMAGIRMKTSAFFARWDLGTTWKAMDNLEVTVAGQNLEGAHQESLQSSGIAPVKVVPSVYGQVTVRY
jgi:hypothetical protein